MIRLRALSESIRSSLFYVPMLFVFAAIVLAQMTLQIDLELGRQGTALPVLLSATVESARALLSTVAAATITFAGVAFSVSLLMIQQASSQFSPRVLYGFFRDPISKRVMGIAVGTFTYALMVLRAVRAPIEENGEPVIPNVSVFVALLFGVVAILAVIAFINHSAHSMEVGEIIRRIADEARARIRKQCPDLAGESRPSPVEGPMPQGPPMIVRARGDGWVQQIDTTRLLGVAPEGGVIKLEAGAGFFVSAGDRLCTIWPAPAEEDEASRAARSTFAIGRSRTMQQDMAYGFRQIVDIGLRALSPGINDPTTAYEAIVHLGPVLKELLLRDLPPRVIADEHERRLIRPFDLDHTDYVDLAIDQLRRAGAGRYSVSIALLELLGMLQRAMLDAELPGRIEPLKRQARLILAGFEADRGLPEDFAQVVRAAERLELVEPDPDRS